MSKRNKKLLSLLLSTMMVFSVVPSTVYAAPDQGTEATVEQDANEEVKQEDTVNNEADASADQTDTKQDEAKADDTAQKNDETAEEENVTPQTAENAATGITLGAIDLSGIKFDGANAAVVDSLMKDQDVKIDESDPTIAQLKKELESIEIVGGEGETDDSGIATYAAETEEDNTTKNVLSDEQINNILGLFQQYQNQWKDNANVLGVQMPFYLSYNDSKDKIGILGEMLVLAGKSVDDVRKGDYTYDNVSGMILNFLYGDKYGLDYYKDAVVAARNKGLQAVKNSGAKTEVQKLLALNDYLAQINTFDMAYIMNSGDKAGATPTMQAPGDSKNPNWTAMYNEMYTLYKPRVKESMENKIKAGLFDNYTKQYLRNSDTCKNMTDKEFQAYLETEDGKNAYNAMYSNVEADITANGVDIPRQDESGNYVIGDDGNPVMDHYTLDQIVEKQMNTPMDDLGGKTPTEYLPTATEEAATQLTDGIVNYWEGTQFGAMALGKSVCLGYSKAYAYMIQCMHPEIYTTDNNIDKASSWKTAQDLYYAEDGKTLNPDNNYVVDLVRITFDTSVTMYGTENNGFNSDHFWNAVKVDGKWYYIDPCYTDVYTEVMSRNRAEINGSMNHMYFMFSDTSARKMYDDYFKDGGLKTLYEGKATDKSYENAWTARINSTTSFDGNGNAYYSYSSQDLFSMITSDNPDYTKMMNTEYKIVRHKMSEQLSGDKDDGDEDYDTLIFINKEASSSSKSSKASGSWGSSSSNKNYVAQVYNPETDKLEDNDMLTKAVKEYMNNSAIYPSIFTSSYYYNGKVYFNINNDIYTYNLSDGKVTLVKEYNEVTGHRDATVAFGAMAFTTATPAKDAEMDIKVNNAPIAGFTIKDDTMYVSIATNYAWVSGRTQHDVYSSEKDKNGNYPMIDSVKDTYGYEFQESNYNQSYSNYKTNNNIGNNNDDKNDNDEFMWTACITDTINMKHFDADHTKYDPVTVAPSCGKDGYTENRCSECGKIEDGSRTYTEKSAVDHHYVHYVETYYTKSNGEWNTGDSYVCVDCGYAVQSDDSDDDLNSETGEGKVGLKDTYKLAKKKAGHTYAPVKEDAVDWASESDGKITLAKDTDVSCTDCSTKKLDCLQSYTEAGQTVTTKTDKDITLDVSTSHTGTCDTGVVTVHTATGKDANNNTITAIKKDPPGEPGQHQYTGKVEWKEKKDADGKGTGEYEATVTDVKCTACPNTPKEDQITVDSEKDTENSVAATCEEDGKDVWKATVTVKSEDGSKVIGSFTDTKKVTIDKLGHKYGKPTINWTKGENNTYTATASRVCENDASHVETIDAKVTEKSEEASCTEAGKVTYTATAKFDDGKEITDTKEEAGIALGHDYKVSEKDGWKWTADKENGYTAKATFVCSRCKDSHEVDATVTKEEKDGQVIYTANANYTDKSGKEFTAKAEKKTKLSIYYEVHRQDYGWEVDTKDEDDLTKWKSDGAESGTVGESKRLEAIKIKLPDGVSGSIEYRTHIQDIGWEKNWAKDGEPSGTSGQAKRLEAIQVKLTGNVAKKYDVYYCVHAQNFGWLGWAKNGKEAGTAGYGYRLEAIKIMLVPKGEDAPDKVGKTDTAMEARLVGYQTHVQDYGTQDYVYDGATAGTSGESKRMESIRIKLPSTTPEDGGIEYRSHIQDIGWEKNWKKTGELSGTTGQSKRLEAIQIRLKGAIKDKYDVYYRVHAQNFGWLGWAKNGEEAGTAGYSYRLEAVQIVLIPKGTENPTLPGPASAKTETFIEK